MNHLNSNKPKYDEKTIEEASLALTLKRKLYNRLKYFGIVFVIANYYAFVEIFDYRSSGDGFFWLFIIYSTTFALFHELFDHFMIRNRVQKKINSLFNHEANRYKNLKLLKKLKSLGSPYKDKYNSVKKITDGFESHNYNLSSLDEFKEIDIKIDIDENLNNMHKLNSYDSVARKELENMAVSPSGYVFIFILLLGLTLSPTLQGMFVIALLTLIVFLLKWRIKESFFSKPIKFVKREFPQEYANLQRKHSFEDK